MSKGLKTYSISEYKKETTERNDGKVLTHIEKETTIYVEPVRVKTHYYFLTKENKKWKV